MVDGIDGLVGMLSMISFTSIALMFNGIHSEWFLIPIVFIAATLAYLMFNLGTHKGRRGKIFMGDAGSMLIGFTVIWLLIIGSQGDAPAFKPVTALWIISVPLMDMAAIMVRRVRKGDSPFKPDREHLHHIFMRAGFSSKQTLFIISSIAFFMVAIGVAMDKSDVPEWKMMCIFLIFFAVYSYAINHVWRLLTLFRKFRL
jgi:UDP-GlcNAc:undecaprenyl-phosphate GlcNAc-1-phosphate transferase